MGIVDTMAAVKFLIALACIQVLGAAAFNLDWSKITPKQPRTAGQPHKATKPQQFVAPPLRYGTKNMRAEGCEMPNRPASGQRIVGGWETGINEFPWQVAVFIAAHCAEDAGFFELMLGAHNVRLDASQEPQRVEVTATDYYIYPSWDTYTLRNDIAIIKMPAPITYTDVIYPICLPSLDFVDPPANTKLELSGWGRPSDSASSISPVLRYTNVTTITNDECGSVYSIINDNHICIDTSNGHGSCNGDSGGPLSQVQSDGRFTQVGIVSFGSSAGCEVGYPAGFTRVTGFLAWISALTGIRV